ncbi:MAG: DUF502 domain-containing protein [Rhizobiaceae bacterium]
MARFFKTTVLGGIVFLVPFAALMIVLGKVLPIARKLVDPIVERLPYESLIGLDVPVLLTLSLILLICFAAGLLARTRVAKSLVGKLETAVLKKIPGYDLLQSMSADVVGMDDKNDHKVVLVRFDDAWQFGLKIDEISGGKLVAVFIPDSPTPQTGSVMIVEANRVKPTNIPIISMFACLKNRGTGVHKLLSARPS